MRKLLSAFEKHYDRLYEGKVNPVEYAAAIAAFDSYFEANESTVRAFNRYRGDLLSSDREVAAFMLAVSSTR